MTPTMEIAAEAASYISLKATSSTIVITEQFTQLFEDGEVKRKFFRDVLSLFIDIYHRLGAGYIDKNGCLFGTAKEIDERVGAVAGMAFAMVDNQKEKREFMEGINSDQCFEVLADFHDWSIQFDTIHGSSKSLIAGFVEKWASRLSIKDPVLHRFSFYLADLVRQYMTDVRFNRMLNIV